MMDLVVAWTKFLHVGAICVWSAGLIGLPVLYRQRAGLHEQSLYRLHAFTRSLYIAYVSPAAFVAIGSGTALIFLQGTYENWFSAKLFFVAVLTFLHIFSGLMILRLFEPEGVYPAWRFALVMPLTLFTVLSILMLVLGKPEIAFPQGVEDFFAPGALRDMAEPIIGGMI